MTAFGAIASARWISPHRWSARPAIVFVHALRCRPQLRVLRMLSSHGSSVVSLVLTSYPQPEPQKSIRCLRFAVLPCALLPLGPFDDPHPERVAQLFLPYPIRRRFGLSKSRACWLRCFP